MAITRRLKSAFLALLAVVGILLWFVALLLFTRVTENSDDFARLQTWIVPINSIGIAVLLVLIIVNVSQLIRDYRRQVPGSRLRARMVTVLALVAITPLVGVYIFSVEFINRGIDNWFNVDIEKGLKNVLQLGQTAFDIQARGKLDEMQRLANRLANVDRRDLLPTLNALRADSSAVELTVYGPNAQILATTAIDSTSAVPKYPSDEVLFQLRQAQTYVSVDPQPDGGYQIMAATPLATPSSRGELEFVQGVFPVDQQLATRADAVQATYNQFSELSYIRTRFEIRVYADAEPRAPDLDARVRLRRVLLFAQARGADSTPDARHARRRARRLRDASADADPRRDRLPRPLVQRHDSAAREGERGSALEPAAGRERAAQARGDPRALVDRRRRARARHADPHGEPGRECNPR